MSNLPTSLGLAILSLAVFYFAARWGYFSLLNQKETWKIPLRWLHVAVAFCIYFTSFTIALPLLYELTPSLFATLSPIAKAVWINFFLSLSILIFISLYLLYLPKEISSKIWKKNKEEKFLKQLGFVCLTFLIATPAVICVSESLDWLLRDVFHFTYLPEQLAVYFLKSTFEYPRYFFLSIITIVIFAPMLEEVLFRGFLQSYLRQHLGSKNAIWLSSACFSLFHYSAEQGAANVSILASLFVFALFLGFAYEKRGALPASISLHALFNAVSAFNLYLIGG